MLEKLKQDLQELASNPPGKSENLRKPEPETFKIWKNKIRRLRNKINKVAEEDARQQINRP